jgi:excisionase family DNA binding protein
MSSDSAPALAPILVDSREAARLLGISPRTVWNLTATGQSSAVRIGRSVRYSIDDLRSFANGRKGGAQ